MHCCTALRTTRFNGCSQCRTPRRGWSLVLGDLNTSRRSCARCTGYPSVSESHSSCQRLSTSAWTARPRRPVWLLSTDWRPSLRNEISGDLDTPRATREIHIRRHHLLSQGQASGTYLPSSCHTRSVTVQSMFQETAEDSSVWMTNAALVRLNWRLRNVFTYLLTFLSFLNLFYSEVCFKKPPPSAMSYSLTGYGVEFNVFSFGRSIYFTRFLNTWIPILLFVCQCLHCYDTVDWLSGRTILACSVRNLSPTTSNCLSRQSRCDPALPW